MKMQRVTSPHGKEAAPARSSSPATSRPPGSWKGALATPQLLVEVNATGFLGGSAVA